MSLSYVNCSGEQISTARIAAMKAKGLEDARRKKAALKPDERGFHKGWRVTGIAPGLLDEARESHERLRAAAAKIGGKEFEPFNEAQWRLKQRQKPVRSKPYEVYEAAIQCKQLAEKTGWLDVRLLEIKKEAPRKTLE